jgi:hypothetical protein
MAHRSNLRKLVRQLATLANMSLFDKAWTRIHGRQLSPLRGNGVLREQDQSLWRKQMLLPTDDIWESPLAFAMASPVSGR